MFPPFEFFLLLKLSHSCLFQSYKGGRQAGIQAWKMSSSNGATVRQEVWLFMVVLRGCDRAVSHHWMLDG